MNWQDAFAAIHDEVGYLDPEDIHDRAKDPAHPLHSRYEWDDAVAGRKYRLGQIRSDIREIECEVLDKKTDETFYTRTYVSQRECGGVDAVYVKVQDALIDPTASKILENEMRRAIAQLKRRYGNVKRFGELLREGLAEFL